MTKRRLRCEKTRDMRTRLAQAHRIVMYMIDVARAGLRVTPT